MKNLLFAFILAFVFVSCVEKKEVKEEVTVEPVKTEIEAEVETDENTIIIIEGEVEAEKAIEVEEEN